MICNMPVNKIRSLQCVCVRLKEMFNKTFDVSVLVKV